MDSRSFVVRVSLESQHTVNDEIQALLRQLSGDGGWLAAVTAWLFYSQTLAKLAQPRVTEALTRLFARVIETEDTDDDARLIRVLSSFRYWIIGEILDLLLRVKLPTLADFRRLSAHPKTPTPEDWNSI